MVYLMMNTGCSKCAEDTKNWIKTFIWKVCSLLVYVRNCITMHDTKNINCRLLSSKHTLINSETNDTSHMYVYTHTHTLYVCIYAKTI